MFFSCFISEPGVFFGAFLTPILLLLIINVVIYILILRVLILHYIRKKQRMSKDTMSTSEILKIMLSFIGIMFLFGLSWLFAIFTFDAGNDEASFAAQMMFTLLNVFQGFFVFIFFVVLNSDCRDAWKNLLTPWNKSKSLKSKFDLTSSKEDSSSTSANVYSKTSTLMANLRKHEGVISQANVTTSFDNETCNKSPVPADYEVPCSTTSPLQDPSAANDDYEEIEKKEEPIYEECKERNESIEQSDSDSSSSNGVIDEETVARLELPKADEETDPEIAGQEDT